MRTQFIFGELKVGELFYGRKGCLEVKLDATHFKRLREKDGSCCRDGFIGYCGEYVRVQK